MKKVIGILAHVDAGKTTFSEQVLYNTNAIRSRGRVDHKNSFLDSHNIEKSRGITVFSDQAIFKINNSEYYLIDTPGHIDFSTEMERALSILDYAILIIDGVEGIQGHTETIWTLLRKYNIPTFFFINKMDRVGANLNKVIEEIRLSFTKDVCYVKDVYNMEDELIEFISERSEQLLEKYFLGNYDNSLWIEEMKKIIKNNEIFPCFSGSALQDEGVIDFLNNFDILTYTEYDDKKEFSGRVHKVRYDENGTRITFIKALEGTLKVRDEIKYIDKNGEELLEKISSIRIYNGNKFITSEKVSAGDVFAITGISKAMPGYGVGNIEGNNKFNMIPTLMSKVIFDEKINVKEVLSYFRILENEDPALNVLWNERLKEIQVSIMGKIQLDVLKDVIEDRFKLKVDFGPCKIMYKETISNICYGYGHFEPLKHYAEVHLKLEPNKRGKGITFENKCHTDNLNYGTQNLIKTHIFEKNHNGLLTGFPITDIKITLLTGRDHNKHTEGGDFREATFRAIRQALEKAENILLEPYYKFKIDVDLDYMGKVLSDIQRLNGNFEPPVINLNKVSIKGRGPVSTFMDYSIEILTFTKGKGSINLIFDGYDRCHNEEEVIREIGYRKDADIEYTSNSVFCSKGQGFIVPWDKVEEYIHCEIVEN